MIEYIYYSAVADNNADNNTIALKDEMIYRPKNCKGYTQKLLIYNHLLVHYQQYVFGDEIPDCHHIQVQAIQGQESHYSFKH